MGYRLDWRLLGRDNRLLDSGEIDSGFRDRRSALEALGAFLHQFALWGRDASYLTAAGEEALREIQALEQQLSFYRDDSEIRALNVYAARRPVPVEPRVRRSRYSTL